MTLEEIYNALVLFVFLFSFFFGAYLAFEINMAIKLMKIEKLLMAILERLENARK